MSRKSPNFKRNKSVADLLSDTRKPRILADTAWYRVGEDQQYEIPFEDGWDNVTGEGNPPAAFMTDENGWVRLRGKVDGGDEGSIIFTLPEECRPEFYEPFVVKMDDGGTANIGVFPDGTVVLENFNA